MGVVFKARHIQLNRLVALKMILGEHRAGLGELAGLRKEAEAVARLRHPSIVQIYEIGDIEGRAFISFEFVEGGSLDRRLKHNSLPPREAAALVEELARAMHAVHEQNIVHRDLKPANILLTADGRPKIADFGLAKRLDAGAGSTQTGVIMGTPSFMAPEQAMGSIRDIGPATDVYALGAILYCVLTGRPPFLGTTSVNTVSMVVSQEAIPPRRLQSSVPRDLETICLKCLEKPRENRYPSAAALADDLRRYQNGEPIQARPASVLEKVEKWIRRKPAQAALVGVGTVALMAILASIGLYARAQSQAKTSIKNRVTAWHQIDGIILGASQFEADNNLVQAEKEYLKAQAALELDPTLPISIGRDGLNRRLEQIQARLNKGEEHAAASKRMADFQSLYDDALLYETIFLWLDPAESRNKASAAVRSALAIYGLDQDAKKTAEPGNQLEKDKAFLNASDHAQVAAACYELLLIWAEAETSAAGAVEQLRERQVRARKALDILDRAASLSNEQGLDTRVFQARRASYLAQEKETSRAGVLDKQTAAQPVGLIDWFLEALDRYRDGQFDRARAACAEVVRQESTHFWARYLQALCQLRLRHWPDAITELTYCATQRIGRPASAWVWPRLLRGYAYSELGNTLAGRQQLTEFAQAENDYAWALEQSKDPLVQYVGLLNRGILNIRRKKWEPAVVDLRRAVEMMPNESDGYANLAQALEGMGKRDEASVARERAVKIAPKKPLR